MLIISQVLDKDGGNEKAKFRLAKGLHLAGELEKALPAYAACHGSTEATRLHQKAKVEGLRLRIRLRLRFGCEIAEFGEKWIEKVL